MYISVRVRVLLGRTELLDLTLYQFACPVHRRQNAAVLCFVLCFSIVLCFVLCFSIVLCFALCFSVILCFLYCVLVLSCVLYCASVRVCFARSRTVSVCVLCQYKELVEDVKQSLYTVDILRPSSVYNRILRAIIHHAADCSDIHCPLPWCYFFSRRHVFTYLPIYFNILLRF